MSEPSHVNLPTTPIGSSHLDALEDKGAFSPSNFEPEADLSVRISKATAIKNSAKPYVNEGKYDEAIRIYEYSYYALRPTGKDRTNPEFKKCLLLQTELFNDLSFCYASLERFQESVEYAKRVLLIDGENTKALYRSAFAHKNLGQFSTAYEEIKKAKQAYKRQNPDQPLDGKIQELYFSLQKICKDEKDLSPVSKDDNKEPKPVSALSNRFVRYGLCLGPVIILTAIGYRVVRERTVQAVKRQIPAIVTAIGALLVLRYIKNNVSGSVWGLGLAVAAAIMIQRTSKEGVFYKK